jgi:MFS family permease
MFALFYVVLAPFVGAFADAMPKGKVMFVSNAIKVVGCLMMLFGTHPLLAYAIVGLGAAAYSPAKYGILTELLPASQLVKANGWIEGLTIASIILGILLGGQLVGHAIASRLLALDFPLMDTGIDTPPEAAISVLIFVYAWRPGSTRASRTPASRCGRSRRTRWNWCPTSGLQLAPVARQAGADLAGHHHAVLGRQRATCATSSWPGARGAGLQHHAGLVAVGVVAWAPPSAPSWRPCACGWTWPPA